MKHTIISLAPIRICDLGGWTDTWFAKRGFILNIAVKPYAQCILEFNDDPHADERFFISVDDYGDRYKLDPQNISFGKHPLLEACVKSLDIPRGLDIEVSLHSSVPGGSSTGTSAAITVALLGALHCLAEKTASIPKKKLAMMAHEVETVLLKQQSGIQDQICSAFGGINFIEMEQYPNSTVKQIPLAPQTLKELDNRMLLFFLGRPHYSTTIHEEVIRGLVNGTAEQKLEPLRREAICGRDALLAGELAAFGLSMIRNTEAQGNLNAALVSRKAQQIFEIAKRHHALGWKVNGAGGDGGSVSILASDNPLEKKNMLDEINAMGDGIREIGIRLDSEGIRVIQRNYSEGRPKNHE